MTVVYAGNALSGIAASGWILRERPGPRLIDRQRGAIRARHLSTRTEQAYLHWTVRYLRFHGLRHPSGLGPAEVNSFLTDLAVRQG